MIKIIFKREMVVNKIRHYKDDELELTSEDKCENDLIRIFKGYETMDYKELFNDPNYPFTGAAIKKELFDDLKIGTDVFIYKKPKTRYDIARKK